MMANHPLVAAFAEQVGKRYAPDRPDSFWTCEPLFRHLLDRQFTESVINGTLQAMADDPGETGSGGGKAMVLARTPAWQLSLQLLTRPRRYLHGNVSYAFVAPVGDVALVVDRYELPAGFRNAVFDPAQKLSRGGSQDLPPGELLRLEVDGPIADFRIDRPLLILSLETAPLTALEWRFSRDTLHAWQYADADPQISDLKAAAWLAGRLAHQTSLKPLKALASHDNPGVRWAALQGIGRLSRSEAARLLTEALADPHPQVRRAARLALERNGSDSAVGH